MSLWDGEDQQRSVFLLEGEHGRQVSQTVEDSPICDDAECNGPHDTEICIQGTYKDCPCLLVGKSRPGQVADKNWWDQQQQIIESVIANPDILGTAAPACTVNSNTHDFDGNPAQVPATWCVCNDEGQNKVYSTVNTPSSPCALTALPTATITISNIASTGGPITSCRIASMVTAGTTIGTWVSTPLFYPLFPSFFPFFFFFFYFCFSC